MKRIGIDAHMLGDSSGGNETFYSGLLSHMQIPENIEIYLFIIRSNISPHTKKNKQRF